MRRNTRTLVALLVQMAVVLSACSHASSATSSEQGSVHPFDEIRASELVFEADPSDPTRGEFHVTTSVPTICAIVWGPDTSFGRFNNSLSMNGTGITQHDVILPGIEVGATYSYVIEGVAADGTLYRSTVGTFRIDGSGQTPAAAAPPAPGKDITAQAKVVAVSSEYSPAFAASNAIDGDAATEWATKGDGDHGSITLDLGTAVDIKGVEFVTRSMADGTARTTSYTVTVDGAAPLGPFPTGTLAEPHPVAFTAHGRTVRLDVAQSTGGNVGAVEIRIYG